MNPWWQQAGNTIVAEFSDLADPVQMTRVVVRPLFVLVSQQTGMYADAMSRVIQGIIAGVGFLCAGTIIKGNQSDDVKGLTTAAGLWLTAAVGVAAGLGRETTAVLGTLLALAVLSLVPIVVREAAKPTPLVTSDTRDLKDKQ
jgi:putative Mg2+ transporter-C (MgtC) family protein